MERGFLEVRLSSGTHTYELNEAPVTIGRAASNTVSFPLDASVSEQHALLEPLSSGWRIRDVRSSSGTFVNGTAVAGEQVLQAGDEIAVGRSRLTYCVREPDTPAQVPETLNPWVTAGTASSERPGYLDRSEEWRADAGSEALPGQAPSREGRGHVRGTAHDVQSRGESGELLSFRVDSYDTSGNRLDPVGVELRGHYSGQINDGDEVEVTGKWKHGTLWAHSILNTSTNAHVKGPPTAAKVVLVIFSILVLTGMAAVFGVLIWSIFAE